MPERVERPVRAGVEARGEAPAAAREAWSAMCDLVLHNVRRREVAEALGMSFGRIRAIRRLAGGPMGMSELASALDSDAPYTTVVVDDLERQGLVRRRPDPLDGRARLVEATRKGKQVAARADEILGTPPAALTALDPEDLETLVGVLRRIDADGLATS
jgi:DNA-binding MarR family transcriptional regulator